MERVPRRTRGAVSVLIGHSAGSGVLKRLIREQIDPDPQVREKMVSALLIGSSVAVPTGKRKGGDFRTPDLYRKNQVGCVISLCVLRGEAPTDTSSAGWWHRSRMSSTNRLHQPGRAGRADGPRSTLWYWQADPRSAGRRCGDLAWRYPAEAKDRVVDAEGPVPRQCMTKNGANVLMVKPVGI